MSFRRVLNLTFNSTTIIIIIEDYVIVGHFGEKGYFTIKHQSERSFPEAKHLAPFPNVGGAQFFDGREKQRWMVQRKVVCEFEGHLKDPYVVEFFQL